MTEAKRKRSNRPTVRGLRGGSNAHRWACSAVVLGLAGCNNLDSLLTGDKVDYRAGAVQTTGLDVPPDLTQLSRDSRYQADETGAISASNIRAPQTTGGVATPSGPTVAPDGGANVAIERSGNDRWIVTSLTPEQLWPQLRNFWRERGFTLTVEQADVGVMETEWNENRAKIPQDFLRSTIGRIFDSAWSTSERDRFRTRIERTATGSEIFVSHRGLSEVYTSTRNDTTIWQARPADPELEAEMLRRLLLKLGAKDETATALVANSSATAPARARLLSGEPTAAVELDEDFDRAWRRVGLALDRSGFAVEDRDRASGLYFVRYIDPNPNVNAEKQEPGFISRLLDFGGDKKDDAKRVVRYRVQVTGDGARSKVSILNAEGKPENSADGARIASVLVDDLK